MDTFLIITSNELVSESKHIWGDGSWIDPIEREALEWFMFARIMGWKSKIIHINELPQKEQGVDKFKWIVVACDPEELSSKMTHWLLNFVNSNKALLIIRAGLSNEFWLTSIGIKFSKDFIAGSSVNLQYRRKKGIILNLKSVLNSQIIQSNKNLIPLISLNDQLISAVLPYKASNILLFGFHPIEAMDLDAKLISTIKKLLTEYTPLPIAWIDWKNTMVLRMDDPGSSEIIYHEIYKDVKKLDKAEWQELGNELLKYNSKMSACYVNGWVDDGNEENGILVVNGTLIKRKPGAIYPSQKVVYKSSNGHLFNFTQEYKSLQELLDKGVVQVETHGFTHIHPDTNKWLGAPSKYSEKAWYREFGKEAYESILKGPPSNHPLIHARKALQRYWNDRPMVLIFPGEEFTLQAQADALQFGWQMVSSYYQAVKYDDRFCWTQNICSPYLNDPDKRWIDSEMPFVGYFHDFDLSINGIKWFSDCINNWKKLGVKKFVDLRTLLIGLNYKLSIEENDGTVVLNVDNELSSEHGYPYQIKLRPSSKGLPKEIIIKKGDDTDWVRFENIKENKGVFTIPSIF